jgi:hypothetical protein
VNRSTKELPSILNPPHIIMAALAESETSFILLLRAVSEHALSDTDADVMVALDTYGVAFKRIKKDAPARLELLAGLMWVHAHQFDLHTVWSAVSVARSARDVRCLARHGRNRLLDPEAQTAGTQFQLDCQSRLPVCGYLSSGCLVQYHIFQGFRFV